MVSKYIYFACLLCLTACVAPLTRDQQLQIYRTRCLEYGYEPGTVEFAHCMKEQERFAEELALREEKIRILRETQQLKRREVDMKEKESLGSKLKVNW